MWPQHRSSSCGRKAKISLWPQRDACCGHEMEPRSPQRDFFVCGRSRISCCGQGERNLAVATGFLPWPQKENFSVATAGCLPWPQRGIPLSTEGFLLVARAGPPSAVTEKEIFSWPQPELLPWPQAGRFGQSQHVGTRLPLALQRQTQQHMLMSLLCPFCVLAVAFLTKRELQQEIAVEERRGRACQAVGLGIPSFHDTCKPLAPDTVTHVMSLLCPFCVLAVALLMERKVQQERRKRPTTFTLARDWRRKRFAYDDALHFFDEWRSSPGGGHVCPG